MLTVTLSGSLVTLSCTPGPATEGSQCKVINKMLRALQHLLSQLFVRSAYLMNLWVPLSALSRSRPHAGIYAITAISHALTLICSRALSLPDHRQPPSLHMSYIFFWGGNACVFTLRSLAPARGQLTYEQSTKVNACECARSLSPPFSCALSLPLSLTHSKFF